MKLHQEDSRLTAYILGELPPEEERAVGQAVAGDPALRLLVTEMEKAQSRLSELLGTGTEALLPRQRENIRRAAKEATRKGKVERLRSHRQAHRVWLVPLAAAAVIAAGIFILTKIPSTKGGGSGLEVSTNSIPKISAVPTPEQGAPGSIRLPLRTGRESLAKVSNAVRIAGHLPSKDEVSIPEMLNSFPLKPLAWSAPMNGCELRAEIIPCPWKPSASLILVGIHGAKDGERGLSVEYRADGDSVITHRLIGYPPVSHEEKGAGVSKMASNSTMLLLIEVEAKTTKLGELIWAVEGNQAPAIPLVRDPEKEPSDDARFAALVCGFGLWLRGESPESVDDAMVLGLAREVAADGMIADRYDFLELVDDAMKLAGRQ